MGRPPIGKQAMSATERQRRWRAKLRGSKPVTKTVTLTKAEAADIVALVTQMQKRIAELEGRSVVVSKGSVTLYDLLLSTYAAVTNRRARCGQAPRAARKRRQRGHR